jgi:AraC family transcriptional regulator of adaptative response / DNA-3-methyladenine glycosylase II
LTASIELDHVGGVAAIVSRLRRLFDLDADVALIGSHLARDPRLAARVARRPGLRVPGAWDGFETAVRAILGQQVSVAAARKLAGKLVARFGEPMPGRFEGPSRRFPRPEALVGADVGTLGMPRARGRAIESLAAAVAREPDILAPVGALDANIRRLRALPGIGEWTAHYIAMRVLGEPDAFPASDVGLLRAAASNGKRPSPDDLLEIAERWRPWRAYAAQHLWTSDHDEP